MSENTTKKVSAKKVLSIVMIVLFSLFALGVLIGVILELAAPANAFAVWSKENVWDVTTLPAAWRAHQKTVIHCLILIVVIFAVSKLLRLIFKRMMQKSNRAKTVITLLDGIIKYGAALALIFLVLQAFGVNTAAIWESVGVITLIVGLGA